LVEFEIDGEKFILMRGLTSQELRAMNEAYDRIWQLIEKSSDGGFGVSAANKVAELEMIFESLQNCFGLTRAKIDNTSYFTLMKLYSALHEYSLREHGMRR
jgi:hypothetical protein